MNLYHINTDLDESIIKNSIYDIKQYIDFINNSIDFLKKETITIEVEHKKINEKESINNKEQFAYTPKTPKNKKEEKDIDILFNENTKSIFDQNENFHFEKSIKVLEQNEGENYIILNKAIKNNKIFLKPDTYQLEQQRKALNQLKDKPLTDHIPLLKLFGHPNHIEFNNSNHMSWEPEILTDNNRDGVNEQIDFVNKALLSNDFALLEGPPGSGKTTTIIELIIQFVAQGKRVLLCSATHAAVDNVIERIKGRYKNICDNSIIPIRISRFAAPVKETVRPYLLSNIVKEYKEDIKTFLAENQELESQQYLIKNLSENHQDDPIEQIILESANLVAGTMIGILQYPDIRNNKQGASFDVLIVDEASKVTFSDFIVPALHAKKWILVGDIKQLSPYIENDYVSENIAKKLSKEEQLSIVKQFELRNKLENSKYKDTLKVYFTNENINHEFKILSKEYPKYHIVKVDDSISTKDIYSINDDYIYSINSADVLICLNTKKVKEFLAKNIFLKSILINSTINQNLEFIFRQYSFHKHDLPIFNSRDEDWAEMVASRLNQSFSFRNAGEDFANIDKELELLIPDKIQEEIFQIKRLTFPSILEILQVGSGKSTNQKSDRIISDGFSEEYKDQHFVSLTYQHRMHPDIAKTSKENFYEGNLKSSNSVLKNKNWKYAVHEPAVKWIHNNDSSGNGKQIINPTEIKDIENELIKFLEWAKQNPKPNGEFYEIAILSFYLNQEREIRKRIRAITQQKHFAKFHKYNTDIFLYTVDKFQGQEADIVLLGFTKFTKNAHYNSPNRLNVGLTRARHKLVLFGNREWFKKNAKLKALRDLANNFQSIIKY